MVERWGACRSAAAAGRAFSQQVTRRPLQMPNPTLMLRTHLPAMHSKTCPGAGGACPCPPSHLREAEEQRHVAVDALLLQHLAGADALPGGGNLSQGAGWGGAAQQRGSKVGCVHAQHSTSQSWRQAQKGQPLPLPLQADAACRCSSSSSPRSGEAFVLLLLLLLLLGIRNSTHPP